MLITEPAKFSITPKKIISLVPSQTELLYYLGLNKEVIGITKFCVHPSNWFRNKKRVGGTKTLNVELIRHLEPDLIICNKEENVKEQIELLITDYNVWISDVNNFSDSLDMIRDIGHLVKQEKRSEELVNDIEDEFIELEKKVKKNYKGLYLIWKDPYMTIGDETFINDMMKKCGITNVFQNEKRYPEISIKQINESDSDLVLLSSEPFPFKNKHLDEFQKLFIHKKIILVDGEMFSWYGSRLLYSPAYFMTLLQSIL